MSLYGRYKAYTATDDSLAGVANLLAMVLGGNQPFYPVYLFLLFGWAGWPSLICSGIAFVLYALVPLIMRRSTLWGRIYLCLSSDFHVLFTASILGEQSGILLFLAPCIMIGTMLFRGREKWLVIPLGALPLAIYYFTRGNFPVPLLQIGDAQMAELFELNAFSMGVLTAFIGFNIARERESPSADEDRLSGG